MSETTPVPKLAGLSQEQLDKIAGGSCTAEEWITIAGELKQTYDTLIDFTSYVIERVVTSTTN